MSVAALSTDGKSKRDRQFARERQDERGRPVAIQRASRDDRRVLVTRPSASTRRDVNDTSGADGDLPHERKSMGGRLSDR